MVASGKGTESAKGLATLLDAWTHVTADAELLIAGTGSLDDAVRQRVASASMPPVRLLGHQDREQLADRYAEADVFVFPSVSDPWGLVVNEAMAAGLPVIASSAPGAVDDLVEDHHNGLVVPPFEAGRLADAMELLAGDGALRRTMGQRSSERIRRFEPLDWARGMRAAVLSVARVEAS